MRDVVFLSIIIGFFALAAAYVRVCAWIIGPDVTSGPEIDVTSGPEVVDVRAGANR